MQAHFLARDKRSCSMGTCMIGALPQAWAAIDVCCTFAGMQNEEGGQEAGGPAPRRSAPIPMAANGRADSGGAASSPESFGVQMVTPFRCCTLLVSHSTYQLSDMVI